MHKGIVILYFTCVQMFILSVSSCILSVLVSRVYLFFINTIGRSQRNWWEWMQAFVRLLTIAVIIVGVLCANKKFNTYTKTRHL